MKNIKKKLRMVALASLICVVVTALTGCFSLQELKEQQAYFDDEGNICVGNYKYIAIDVGDDFYPEFGEYKEVYISDEEIPLLLSPMAEITYTMSGDGIFIDGDEGYYCREDKYEEVTLFLSEEYKPKAYKWVYYDFETTVEKEQILTGEEKDKVDEIFETVSKQKKIPKKDDYYELANVYSFSDMKYLSKWVFDIAKNGEDIYLKRYEGKNDREWFYKVPEDKKYIFNDVVKAGEELYMEFEEHS